VKKLSYTYVKERIESEGYELLSEDYVNAYTILTIKCPNGHIFGIPWQKWNVGRRCKYCGKSIYIEDVKTALNRDGYVLLSNVYNNSKLKLDMRCPKGHLCSISWAHWGGGTRCRQCYVESLCKPYEQVSSFIDSLGYTLLTTEDDYRDSRSKLRCICDRGHEFTTTHNMIYTTKLCPVCNIEKRNSKMRNKLVDVFNAFAAENYKLLTTEYNNAFQKLKYECPSGHIHSIKWNDWQQGYRCPTCAVINNTGPNHWNWKGGISCEPYCDVWLDKEFKESIKARDNYMCQNPYCWNTNNKLTIHHIDYNKKNCNPNNLITLCRSCNVRANYNRDLHMERYRIIMTDKYKYNYGGI